MIVNKTRGTTLRADGTGALDPACQFTIKRSGDWVGLRSASTGCYVSVGPDSRVNADSPNFADDGHTWERFRLEGDYLFNQGQGRYLRLGDGDAAVMERIGGSLKYVACGADGAVWGVNSGGNIYRWLGGGWEQIGGSLRMVSVGSATQVWGVNDSNNIYRRLGGSWEQIAGTLRNVAVAADGTVWGVAPDDVIYRWNGSSWGGMPGRARQIAVGSASEVWCVAQDDQVYRWSGSSWDVIPGRLRQISVAADGTVCGVSPANEVCLRRGTGWQVIGSNMLQVGVGSTSLLWGVTLDLRIDRTALNSLPDDVVDGAATSQGPRAAFEIGRAIVARNSESASQSVLGIQANPSSPTYSATDLQISSLRKDAVTSGVAAGARPAAEQAAAVQATATRAEGDGAVAPVLGVKAAAEVDRRARRQRMLEKAGITRPEIAEAVRDSALRFDGASYLEAPAQRPVIVEGVVGSAPTIALGAQFTIEAWIAPERLGDGEHAIVSKWPQSADDELPESVHLGDQHHVISALGVALRCDGSGIFGGGGGQPFLDDITGAERIRRVTIRHGASIDAIQLHWIDRAGALVDGPRHGGGGGTESSFELADDERIVSVAGYNGHIVNHLAFTTNKGNRHVYGTPAGALFSFRIERSARILGLCGRAGMALDAFGLCVVPTGGSGLANQYLHLRDTKHGLCLVAGDVYDGNLYHQQPGARSNALWKLEPVGADQPDVYRIKDARHGKYLVAGDVDDGCVYHQDHQDRPNACWKLVRSVDQGREVYQLIDEKHHKAIVAGDVADSDVYHQDPQDRLNARWTLVDPA